MNKKSPSKSESKKIDNRVILVIASILVLVALIFLAKSFKQNPDGEVIAKVNGKEISLVEVNDYLKNAFEAPASFDIKTLSAVQQKNLVEQYIIEKELILRAKKSSVARDADVAKQIDFAKNKIIKKAFLEQITEEATSNSVIENEYRNLSVRLSEELKGKKEVKAKHILVENQDDINRLLVAIKSGKQTFEEAARQNSKDTLTGKDGGDLGYIAEGSMVAEFEEVAFSTAVGEISAPFKTDFGWHILKITDKRDAKVPPLEDVYFKIKQSISMKTINDYVNSIKDGFAVEIVGPTTENNNAVPAASSSVDNTPTNAKD